MPKKATMNDKLMTIPCGNDDGCDGDTGDDDDDYDDD